MFHCVDCGHEDSTFAVDVAGRDQGAFTYRAKCPKCGSLMVNVVPGIHLKDLRITTGTGFAYKGS